MWCERPWRPMLLVCWERRIGFRLHALFRAFDPVKENAMSDLHRHDLSEEHWLRWKPHLPGSKGNRGRRGRDNRLFLNAVLWKLRTGTPATGIRPLEECFQPVLALA